MIRDREREVLSPSEMQNGEEGREQRYDERQTPDLVVFPLPSTLFPLPFSVRYFVARRATIFSISSIAQFI